MKKLWHRLINIEATDILSFIIFMAFSSNIIGNSIIWTICIFGMFIFWIRKNNNISRLCNSYSFALVILLYCFLTTSALINFNVKYYLKNMYTITPVIAILLLLNSIESEDNYIICNFLEKKKKLLNIIWGTNTMVLGLQIQGIPLMINKKWLNSGAMYEDLCGGIFGAGGTHILAIYSSFMFIFNLCIARKSSKIRYRFYAYTLEILTLLFSAFSDNSGAFFLCFIFGFIYLIITTLCDSKNIPYTMKRKTLLTWFCIILTIIFIINFPMISHFLHTVTLPRIEALSVKNIEGSSSRISIALESLTHINGWIFGIGFGSLPISGGGKIGYSYLGINAFSTIIYLSGISTFIIYLLVYSKMAFGNKVKPKEKGLFFIHFFSCLFLSIYTDIFWNTISTTMFYLIIHLIRGISTNDH